MKKINNIIFDFNGTLIDDGYLCFDIEKTLLIKKNIKPITYEFYKDYFCHPVTKFYELIGLNLSEKDFKNNADYFYSEYKRREFNEGKLFPGVIELLEKLKNDGYNLYILSATEISLLEKQLKERNIYSYFNKLIAANNEKSEGKIEYGKRFVESYKLDKSNAILIGDTIHDYETSIALNLNILLYDKGHNSRNALSKFNKPIVSSFKEIEDYIYNLD